MTTTYAADFQDVLDARGRIAAHAHRTPVMTCATLDALAGRSLFFKCENFQRVGAFKFRGACNAVMGLTDDQAAHGVATHSSGNHAQALALAARIRAIDAHIVMPSDAPGVKRRAVEGYGATVYSCEPTEESRRSTCAEVMEKTGAMMIPPFDMKEVIAGQGTAALELLEQVTAGEAFPSPGGTMLDAVIAPIGGGGLMSGTCVTARGFSARLEAGEGNGVRLFGAEPRGADDAARSLAAGELIPQTGPDTIAEGLLTSLGEHTWPIIRDYLESIITVSDVAIIAAMRLVWERMKIIIEPSSAVAVAAVLTDEFKAIEGLRRVGIIISGGNVDLDHLQWVG